MLLPELQGFQRNCERFNFSVARIEFYLKIETKTKQKRGLKTNLWLTSGYANTNKYNKPASHHQAHYSLQKLKCSIIHKCEDKSNLHLRQEHTLHSKSFHFNILLKWQQPIILKLRKNLKPISTLQTRPLATQTSRFSTQSQKVSIFSVTRIKSYLKIKTLILAQQPGSNYHHTTSPKSE